MQHSLFTNHSHPYDSRFARLRLLPLLKGAKAVVLAVLATCAGILLAPIAEAYQSPPPVIQSQPAEGIAQFTLPIGTPLYVVLQTPIHTQVNQAGDPIEGALGQDIYLYDTLLLSKNTRFKGVITQIDPPLAGRNVILGVRYTEIVLENQQRFPITSYVMTGKSDHTWGGELTPGTIPKKITHKVWGIGNYNKIVMQGPREMGHHLEMLPGERWTVILEQPLVLMNQSQ